MQGGGQGGGQQGAGQHAAGAGMAVTQHGPGTGGTTRAGFADSDLAGSAGAGVSAAKAT
jgi:hypothetical protein